MLENTVNCPDWLARELVKAGGSISFYRFMDLALNDPIHGAYANGTLNIGKKGDFVTSPSLGPEFAELLAIQLLEWLKQLDDMQNNSLPLYLVELGPGDGNLSYQLLKAFKKLSPDIFKKLKLILIEKNNGMIKRQKERLRSFPEISIAWKTLDQLVKKPVHGVVIANELLDSFPVERIVIKNQKLYRQGVSLVEKVDSKYLSYCDLDLPLTLKETIKEQANHLDLDIPPIGVSELWTTEVHVDINNWFKKLSDSIVVGPLLIIDYMLEARRYYSSSRSEGTLIAYKKQKSFNNLLLDPGCYDLTAHLCLELVRHYGTQNNWNFLGDVRQGQALLSLGLSEMLYNLQKFPLNKLSNALRRRESLLNLVDPIGLGEFRWMAFQKNVVSNNSISNQSFSKLFLSSPNC